MAEASESVRVDQQVREQKQKEITDWGGRRFVPPKGTTLPPVTNDLIDGELFMLVKGAGINQLYQFDESQDNWTTVGPRT